MSTIITFAPASVSRLTTQKPRPREPPVTMAVLPVRSSISAIGTACSAPATFTPPMSAPRMSIPSRRWYIGSKV